ncbi:hypothetical protein ACRN96_14465 [Shewanella oncorhynchi]|uniref:hypothetical protein n=1 Tax=Shewanella oncorhynchi TaxID=2726434 RepID=UPI00103FDF82
MDFSSQIILAVIILFANLLSGNHDLKRWEIVTAVFGWAAIVSFIGYVLFVMVVPESQISNYLLQIAGFSLLSALARDYEQILKPFFQSSKK